MREISSFRDSAYGALRASGKAAIKAYRIASQELSSFRALQEMRKRSELDTRFAVATMAAGGFVKHIGDKPLLINNREVYEQHEIAKNYSALKSAISLMQKATEKSPKQLINGNEVSESESFRVIDSKKITRVEIKDNDEYSLVYLKNFDEWNVSALPTTDPNTGRTLVPYYGRGYGMAIYDSTGKPISYGTGHYRAAAWNDDQRIAKMFQFSEVHGLLSRARQEVADRALADLTMQGEGEREDVIRSYELATQVQPAEHFDLSSLASLAIHGFYRP